jgi:predicted ArsR family transcriptional regulator
MADKIITALRERESMTRTEVADLFGRHKSESEITEALERLRGESLAEMQQEQTAGRPIERWRAVRPGAHDAKKAR